MSAEPYEGPAIVELMGHRRLAGIVSQAEQYGCAMLRVDIPGPDGTTSTQFYGGGSIYALTPTTEEIVEAVAARSQPEPVHRWELPGPAEAEVDAEIIDPDDDDDHCAGCGRPINAMGECPVCDQ